MKESMPMDRRIFLLFLSFYCSAFLLAPHAAAVSTPDSIIISEIQIAGKDTDDDFVELYNTTDHSINITGWELRRKTQGDKTTRGTLFHKFEPFQCDTQNPFLKTDTLSPHGFLLWTNKGGKAPFIDHFDVQSDNKMSPALTNDNSLALFDNKEVLINAVTWGSEHSKPFAPSIIYSTNPPKNTSIERTPFDVFFLSQLQPTPTQSTPLSCPTPTLPNPPPDLPPPQDPKLFPSPSASTKSSRIQRPKAIAENLSSSTISDPQQLIFPAGHCATRPKQARMYFRPGHHSLPPDILLLPTSLSKSLSITPMRPFRCLTRRERLSIPSRTRKPKKTFHLITQRAAGGAARRHPAVLTSSTTCRKSEKRCQKKVSKIPSSTSLRVEKIATVIRSSTSGISAMVTKVTKTKPPTATKKTALTP